MWPTLLPVRLNTFVYGKCVRTHLYLKVGVNKFALGKCVHLLLLVSYLSFYKFRKINFIFIFLF